MRLIYILPCIALSACSSTAFDRKLDGVFGIEREVCPAPDTTSAMIVAPPPPVTAVTVEDFDTTTQADRVAATTAVAASDAPLGTTIASLGSPTEPGIWLKTPLVTTQTMGRVTYQGTAINIELRPSGGAPGSGSQISLAAMRLLGAPLTGLPELTIFAGG
ncbi:MAG: D-galactarate dehydratase [Yoonia sp.]|uniref:D-galactarate dehydratase n=1 Tax=Yoonia sp. TaxID=2212373 RepID=UPI003EF92219